MSRTVAIGIQNFEDLIKNNYFYIDKTMFIKEWWESGDETTLITRPRRFGKTLNMSMLECFFSLGYANRGELFEGLAIWQEEKYRALQGAYPVIALSFDNHGFTTNFTAVAATINNIGPGLAEVGPMGSFAAYSAPAKILLSFAMLLGRLEIFPLLLIFTPSMWKKK